MRVHHDNNYSTSNGSKRGVTFDTLDTIERNSDSIDKLTSLVSKMNMKWTNVSHNTSPRCMRVEGEVKINVTTAKTIINPEIGHTVGIKICPIEVEEIMIETIGPIIEVEQEITID